MKFSEETYAEMMAAKLFSLLDARLSCLQRDALDCGGKPWDLKTAIVHC